MTQNDFSHARWRNEAVPVKASGVLLEFDII